MAKKMQDPVDSAIEDGTFNALHTPLNTPKAGPDPQANLDNSIFPGAKGENIDDPMGYLDLTGPKGRRGDPK